jgi:hypothetical protein
VYWTAAEMQSMTSARALLAASTVLFFYKMTLIVALFLQKQACYGVTFADGFTHDLTRI